jgi:hypothetical protein
MKIDWSLLDNNTDDHLWLGTVFRMPGLYPFEEIVDFMLITDSSSESGFSLICTTGYKAGHFECALPKEALASGPAHAIDRTWLIQHWLSHIYPDTDVSKICICNGYPVNVGGTA